MFQAIYRKYRPALFKDLVGQNHIKVTLQNEIENNRIAHAYLFSGPRGVGKTTTARLLAKAINCEDDKTTEACSKCHFCKEINARRSMDVIEIDAASNTGVENVRENIIENSRFTPQHLKYKVFIIDEVHMLSPQAFNALLKTLEEPPEHVIFILATTEIHRVPETIISRCQRFDFKRVNIDDLIGRLQFIAKNEKVKIEQELLENIAQRAEGSVRDAEVLFSQVLALGEKELTVENASMIIPRSNINLVVELFFYLLKNDGSSSISLINKLIDEGVNIQDFNKDLIDFMRRVLLSKVSNSSNELSGISLDEKIIKDIQIQVASVSVGRLVKMIEIVISKNNEFKYSNIIQLPLELAILEIVDTEDNSENDSQSSPPSGGQIGSNEDVVKSKISKPKLAPDKKVHKIETKEKPIKSVPHSALFEKIKESWLEYIKGLREYNHSISMMLKVGVPVSFEGEILIIGFRYKFHAEKVKEVEIKNVIEKYLEEKLSKAIKIKVVLLSEDEFNKYIDEPDFSSSNDNVLNQAVEAFGGEVSEEEL